MAGGTRGSSGVVAPSSTRVACAALLVTLGVLLTVGVAATGGATQSALTAGGDTGSAPVAHAVPPEDAGNGTTALVVLDPVNVGPELSAGEVESRLKAGADAIQPGVRDRLAEMGVTVENRFWIVNALVVTFDGTAVTPAGIESIEGVRLVTQPPEIEPPEPISAARSTPSQASHTEGLRQINAPALWDAYDTRGEGATIVVQDNGFDTDHEALSFAEAWRIDSVGERDGPPAVAAHGTHVAGTATGAEDANGTAFGVAPAAELHAHDIFSANRPVVSSIGSLQIAVEEDADVVSGSWGAGCNRVSPEPLYLDAQIDPIRNARLAGTEVVSSAGNAGEGCVSGFGNGPELFSVGASTTSGGIATFSSGGLIDKFEGQPDWQTGAWTHPSGDWPRSWIGPSVSAPGTGVCSSVPGDDYDCTFSGTSMAAPHVAGSIALLQAATDTDHTGPELREALVETASKPDDWDEGDARWTNGDTTMGQPGIDSRYGHGIIDVYAAARRLTTPPVFEITDLTVPVAVSQGDPVEVTAIVNNTGTARETRRLAFRGDGALDTALNRSLTLAAGAGDTVTFNRNTTTVDPGVYEVGVATNDTHRTARLEVDPSVVTYANHQGVVELAGLLAGIDDFRGGRIDVSLLLEVVDAYRSDTEVG